MQSLIAIYGPVELPVVVGCAADDSTSEDNFKFSGILRWTPLFRLFCNAFAVVLAIAYNDQNGSFLMLLFSPSISNGKIIFFLPWNCSSSLLHPFCRHFYSMERHRLMFHDYCNWNFGTLHRNFGTRNYCYRWVRLLVAVPPDRMMHSTI